MPNLYLPVSALLISAIILFVYMSKKHIHIRENTLYVVMLVSILADSFLVSSIFLHVYTTDFHPALIVFFNKVDYMFLVIWATCLYLYSYIVLHKNDDNFQKMYKVARALSISLSVCLVIFIWHLDIELILIDALKCTAQGPAVTCTIIVCAVYVIISLIDILLNFKKINRQVIPVFVSLIITVVIAVLFSINPYLICVSMGLTLINLSMYFTIENPDLQMLAIVNEAKEEAQRANQAKTDFLSSMSHEIRTPLNAIVGLSECILTDETFEMAKDDAKDIISASQTLLELVNGILDISKIEAGKMELVNKQYNLLEVAENVSKLVSTRIGEKPIAMNTSFSADLPGVLFGDEAKMRQIMTNILTNSIKYTDEGSVDFIINCVNVDSVANIEIIIRDTGRGIKEEQMATLFDKFKRLDEVRNSSIEGTGLGLSITQKLVEMLNGHIQVESTYGEGSTFTVSIPQTIISMEKIQEDKTKQAGKTYPGKRILVVDDLQLNLKVATRILEKYGVTTMTADSGAACLEICAKETFDLILMDDMMPEMNGAETMHRLRTMSDAHIPIVVLTANAIEGMKAGYFSQGFDDYLAKPLERIELQRVLNKFLES